MSDFPLLKTGAVTQYPAHAIQAHGTDIVVFLDGSEQRNRQFRKEAHQWTIALSQLDDEEVRRIEAFFMQQAGSYESFSFTDPWTGIEYPDCSFADDSLAIEFEAIHRAQLKLTILENRH